jgi:histone acetyltransferase (RNA polymerase elongator complex component)
MIIPFFIPHAGCPHQCVFCNQKKITGQHYPFDASVIHDKVNQYIRTNRENELAHIAFYGGTFTALPISLQKEYLNAVRQHIDSGQVESIRISTRPDCINREVLAFLQEYHVQIVELGVQSMADTVLTHSGRGHTAAHTIHAATLLKEFGFSIGLQLMLGLPGDSPDTFFNSVESIIRLKPDFVRLYPLLVLKDTPLEDLYKRGKYSPLSLDEAVNLCRKALMRFQHEGIDVIRIGLQPTEELERSGTMLAGPYHPAFRQLVESSILLEAMRTALRDRTIKTANTVFVVNSRDVSAAIGQQRSNIAKLKKEFGLQTIRIVQQDQGIEKGKPLLLPDWPREAA